MSTLALALPSLPATSPETIDKLMTAQDICLSREQVPIRTEHTLHGGMYSRKITMPPGTLLIGTLIKVPTQVISVGKARVMVGDDWAELDGVQVLPASANRKQMFLSVNWFVLVMVFRTQVKTVEEAEQEMTDEYEVLLSRHQADMNSVVVTGE